MIGFWLALLAGLGVFGLVAATTIRDRSVLKFWLVRGLTAVGLALVLGKLAPLWTRWEAVFDNPLLLWFMNPGLAGWVGGVFAAAGVLAFSYAQIRREEGRVPRGVVYSGVLGSLVFLLAVFLAPRPESSMSLPPQEDLLVPGLDGKSHAVSDWRGHPVALVFWASWSSASLAELAEWKEFLRQKVGDVKVVGVDVLNSETGGLAAVNRFVQDHAMTWSQWTDPDGVLQKGFAIQVLPTTILLDRGGRVVSRHDGPIEVFWLKTQPAWLR